MWSFHSTSLGRVFDRVRGKLLVGDRFIQPWTTLVVADLGSQPDAEQHLDRQTVLVDQFECRDGVLARIVEPDEAETIVDEDLQVFENLFVALVDGAIATVRVLSLAKPGVGHRHYLAREQCPRFLQEILRFVCRAAGSSNEDSSRQPAE